MDNDFLKLLANKFPNAKAATSEIINLRAILALPKGTEYFLSDLHGEHEAFIHMIQSASGIIKSKIDELFEGKLTEKERYDLAALIYNPKAEIKRRQKQSDYYEWCYKSIYNMIDVCRSVSTKYTRSKVRNLLARDYAYILDELLHADDEANRAHYYKEIITAVMDSDEREDFICEMADTASRLAVDKLHIVGDIYDRGAHPDTIMDYLMKFHDVDLQWGNHDIIWMGAAAGHWASICNVLRMNISYNNFDMLEDGYGINLRVLSEFAQKVYGDDPCEYFKPKRFDLNRFDPVDDLLAARMHKAIAICQFKIEGQRIEAHPEYELDHRLLLDKIDFKKGTVDIQGKIYEMRDSNLPTVDTENPYQLTKEEYSMMKAISLSFKRSKQLQKHIGFLFSHGSLYSVQNKNLMYHGCIPMDENGDFIECTLNNHTSKGKAYMDYLDEQIRKAYYRAKDSEETGYSGDLMWYLWLGSKSPLFGKDQMTTFERLFIEDETTHKENTVPYYRLINDRKHCESILKEFGLNPGTGHIINGHVPVKIKDGESPVKGDGKLIIIDGGIAKSYQKKTGIAGYTFIYNSRFMALAEHKPYSPLQDDGTQEFIAPEIKVLEELPERIMVADTEYGKKIKLQIRQLRALVEAFKRGEISEEK